MQSLTLDLIYLWKMGCVFYFLRYTLFLQLQGRDWVYSSIKKTAWVPTAPHFPTSWKRSPVHTYTSYLGTGLKQMSNQMKYHAGLTLHTRVIIHITGLWLMNRWYMDIMQICCNTSVIHLSNDESVWTERGWQGTCANSTLTIKCQVWNRTCVFAAEVSCFTTTYHACNQWDLSQVPLLNRYDF